MQLSQIEKEPLRKQLFHEKLSFSANRLQIQMINFMCYGVSDNRFLNLSLLYYKELFHCN